MRQGTPRHNEQFTRHDLWVSKSHPEKPTEFLFANLPNIVKDEEVVEQTDIVLWCNSAVHHEPRHEDGKPNSGPRLWSFDDAWEGSAIVMWSGFDLRPRNLFDRTPFYPYTPDRLDRWPTSRGRRRRQANGAQPGVDRGRAAGEQPRAGAAEVRMSRTAARSRESGASLMSTVASTQSPESPAPQMATPDASGPPNRVPGNRLWLALYRLTVPQFDRMIRERIIREEDRVELVEGLLVSKWVEIDRMCKQA